MSKPLLYRAIPNEMNTSGRNLEGIAMYWDKASKVTDNGVNFYMEAFAPGSVDKTLRERAAVPLPLGIFHPWRTPDWDAPIVEPVGAVKFRASQEGLTFKAVLATSEDAENARLQLQSRELGDVSVGFIPHKSQDNNGIVLRTEIALYELSLAPIGTGQHEGAQVLAMRAKNTNANLKQIQDTLNLLLKP